MSGYYNQPDSDTEEVEDNTGRGLRAQFEKLLKEHNELKATVKKTSAAEVLKGKGIDPALAELIPPDTTAEAWAEKYGPLLGVKPSGGQEEPSDEQPEVVQQAPEEEDPAVRAEREAVEAMQGAQQDGSPSVITKDAIERMSKINSEEEFMKFLANPGA